MKIEPSEAVKAMARRIVKKVCAEQHVRDDGWVSAYMEDAALAAIMEMRERDDRLTFTERGDLELHAVWALKPGQPQIVAVCTYVELAEKYAANAGQIVPGATGYVEPFIADHAFGRNDMQTLIYRAANRKGPQQ